MSLPPTCAIALLVVLGVAMDRSADSASLTDEVVEEALSSELGSCLEAKVLLPRPTAMDRGARPLAVDPGPARVVKGRASRGLPRTLLVRMMI
jgi:hypothetical protein